MTFKFDLLFEIQVPRPWDDGKEARRFHDVLEQAQLADQMGFNTVWFVEHHFLTEFAHSSAPEVLIGALSQTTQDIRLGFGVTLLPGKVNHPIRVAERTAVADIVSGGRLEVGTGRSSSPYQLEAFGVDVSRTREEWDEALRLLPELWSQENFSYHGEAWSWDDEITVVPRPVQRPHPPLWVASTQPDTCRLAGDRGIGLLLPAIGPPSVWSEHVAAYKAAVADPIDQVGRFKNDQAGLFTIAFCHPDDDRARSLGGPAGLWYLNTITEIYKNDWRGLPLEAVPDSYRWNAELRLQGRAANTGSMVELDDQDPVVKYSSLIDSGAFCIGDPAAVIRKVEAYRSIGGDRLVSVMQTADLAHEDLMQSIELFGTKVIPHFRALDAAPAQPVS